MDQRTQEVFNRILAKNPEELSTDDIVFLRARRSYLKKSQLEEYDEVLNPKTKPPTKETVKENATK